MDPLISRIETEINRRRKRRLFSHARIPVRMLIPNFFTLLGLCAGLTSIRMSIEGRWDIALASIVFAAMLDGIDGRVARLLKASSRFGAELDSLADFVNFGVAPSILLFTWGLNDFKGIGWICALIFALASALRLARFNVSIEEDKPKWQSNFFIGMPTPAAAIVVLLPFYLANLGLDANDSKFAMTLVLFYTLCLAAMMISTIPTYSGKLLGERIQREWVLPTFILAVGFVACLLTFPYETLSLSSVAYILVIPLSWRRFVLKKRSGEQDFNFSALKTDVPVQTSDDEAHGLKVVGFRSPEIKQ
ncbi:MAG: CDP-diacylglycerol--serine O-phosphatidyltransferase [Hyphomicrobium sp.]